MIGESSRGAFRVARVPLQSAPIVAGLANGEGAGERGLSTPTLKTGASPLAWRGI